ncbi:DUF839 domain-containing protein [soil metagenome]
MTTIDRRAFLKRGAAVTAGTLLASTGTQALAARGALAAPGRRGQQLQAPNNGGYGPISPTPDKTTGIALLSLPAGFEYASFGHGVDFALGGVGPYTGSDGFVTPGRHDGMATFATGTAGVIRLVRNHEQGYDPVATNARRDYDRLLIGDAGTAYDPTAAGGCTTMTFDTRTLQLSDSFISLNGTSVNCAGGIYGSSWLSCEETVEGTADGFAKDHGYIFEVPSQQDGPVSDPVPYRAMGRFRHEAVAVDPASGIVYETEDAGRTNSGFYRFLPNDAADLAAGGRLQMLAVKGRPSFATYEGVSNRVGNPLPVTWVDIPRPDPSDTSTDSVFLQGSQAGGAAFARLEGCWFDGGSVFFNATSGGDARAGQVWEYRPRGRSGGQLILLFESPSADVLDAPDNITVSPRGGLVLCEDGGGEQFVRGLNERGEIFSFAQNLIAGENEFAGACFSPDGNVMFVNVQTPGVSFAIRGPWEKGSI